MVISGAATIPALVQALVIAMFVGLHLHDEFADPSESAPPAVLGMVLMGVLAALWASLHVVCVIAGRNLDRTGRFQVVVAAERALVVAQLAGVSLLLYSVFRLGWLASVRNMVGNLVLIDELLALSPALIFLGAAWWSMYPIELRLKEALLWRELHAGAPVHAPLSRFGYVWSNARHAVLPVLLPLCAIGAWGESVDAIGSALGVTASRTAWWGWGSQAAHWSGVLVIFLVTPLMLRLAWNTTWIRDGEIRAQARAVCEAHRVRVRGPLLWRTQGSMVNAAILGLIYPFRYMLFTDALLEQLSRPEVEGVVAHEVGHVKLRHMLWLGLSVLASVLVSGWALAGLEHLVQPHNSGRFAIWATLASLAASFLVFGFVSRRFEWQADAFATRHLATDSETITRTAAETMSSALRSVAILNGMPQERFMFRHGSIQSRRQRVMALIDLPRAALPIDRDVAIIKACAVIAIAAGLAPYALHAVQQ